MTVTADTIRAISRGEYTIGASGTVSESDFATFLSWANAQFSLDNPGNASDPVADMAVALLVCHYIDRGENDQHIASEKAGDGTTGFDASGSNWMKSYKDVIRTLELKAERDRENPGASVKQPSQGVTRGDAGISSKGMFSSSLSR